MTDIERAELEATERLIIELTELARKTHQNEDDEIVRVTMEIPKLTPSDDLEAVKRAVNQIIDLLSKN
jgi:hypothetical protein